MPRKIAGKKPARIENDTQVIATGAPVQVQAKKEGHTCYISPYIGECIGCRNERRWEYYRTQPNPIFGKSGVVRTQA